MADETKTVMQMNIPQAFITDAIRAEIVKGLGNKDELISKIIGQAMAERSRNSYNSSDPSLWLSSVQEMIRDEAKAVFQEWLKANREKIRAAMMKKLNEKGALGALVESLIKNLSEYQTQAIVTLQAVEKRY